MAMSRMARSTSPRAAISTASAPSPASATTTQVGLAVEDQPHPAPHQDVVVGEQDPGLLAGHGHSAVVGVGTTSRISVPPTGAGRRRGPRRSGSRARACRGSRRPRPRRPSRARRRSTRSTTPPVLAGERQLDVAWRRRAGRRWSGPPGRSGRPPARWPCPAAGGAASSRSRTGMPRGRGELGGERAQRAGQAQILEHVRAEPAGDLAHLVEAGPDQSPAPCAARRAARRRAVDGPPQAQQHRGQALPDLVVQFLGDALPLPLLGRQRPARRSRRARPPAGRACR